MANTKLTSLAAGFVLIVVTFPRPSPPICREQPLATSEKLRATDRRTTAAIDKLQHDPPTSIEGVISCKQR